MRRATAVAILLFVCGTVVGVQGPTFVARAPEKFTMRVVATGFASPWEVTWGPDGQLWVTEREAFRVVQVNPADGMRRVLLTMHEVHRSVTQDGLLGLALHPDFGKGTDQVFLAFTYDDAPGPALARRLGIRRYRYDQASRTLVDPVEVLSGLPTHDDHVGGRIAIGPDRKLYLTIGDGGANFGGNRCMANHAQTLPTAAQVAAKNWVPGYQGKILRIDFDGGIPADNPMFGGVRSHVFSAGHRNPLGIAFGPGGRLYESEHGPSSDDEVNLIESGRNYGWPNVAGHKDDKAYTYANWSASTPQPCASLPPGNPNAAIPASVPQQTESSFTNPLFTPPLQTFFTVDTGFDFRLGATMAPGGMEVYTSRAIPGWANSILALSLLRGVAFKMTLAPDGRSIAGPPLEVLKTTNRYRDLAVNPDGTRIYVVTDVSGRTSDANGAPTTNVANSGSLLEFAYAGT